MSISERVQISKKDSEKYLLMPKSSRTVLLEHCQEDDEDTKEQPSSKQPRLMERIQNEIKSRKPSMEFMPDSYYSYMDGNLEIRKVC